MSTPGDIDLQILGKDGEEEGVASYPEGKKPLEQPSKGAVNQVKTSLWKKISLSVLTLLGYTSTFAAISDVAAFYAIVAQNHNVATYIVGFVLGVPNLCLALLPPITAYFLPHLGLKFTQVAGLFLTGGSELLFGLVPTAVSIATMMIAEDWFVSKMPTPTLFIAFSFLLKLVEGIGLTMFFTASMTLLTQLYLERKGTYASILDVSIAIGYMIGVPVGGGLQEAGGFVLPLLVFGGFSLILTLLLLVNVHPTECTSAKLPWRLVLKMHNNILFVLLMLSPIVSIGAYNAIVAYFGHFLHVHFGIRVGIIGAIYLSGLVLNTLAGVSAGPLADKLKNPRYLLIGGLVVSFAGCVMIGPAKFITTPKLWLSILGWVVFEAATPFTFAPVIYPAVYEAVKMLHVEEAVLASTLSGLLVASFAVGQFLGPVIGGALVHQVEFPSMAAICGLILLIYALVLVIATVIEKIWNRKMNAKR